MNGLLVDGMVYALTRPGRIVATFLAVTVVSAAVEVALREKCGLCGERVRVPMPAHWSIEHAGDR